MIILPSGASDLICVRHHLVYVVRDGVEVCPDCEAESQITQDREDPPIPFPEAWRLAIVALGPDDVLILRCPGPLSLYMLERIKLQFEKIFPGRKVMILEAGLELSIVAPTQEDRHGKADESTDRS